MEKLQVELPEQLDARGKPRSEFQTVNDKPSKTLQSDADKADIQKIMRRFEEGGGLEAALNATELRFADVSELGDYQDVLQVAKEAEYEFGKMPAKVREIFDNDVGVWLDTAHDEDKRAALMEAGYLEAPKPVAVEPVTPTSGGAGTEPAKEGEGA